MKKKLVILGLILTLVALPLVACAAPTPAPEPVTRLLMISTSAASGYFAAAVAAADVVNKHAPGVEITVVESASGYGNVGKLNAGDADFSDQITTTVLTESYYGTGKGAEYHNPDLRLLFPENAFVYFVAVRKDSGVTSFKELEGKSFSYGAPGSSAEYFMQVILEDLGVNAVPFRGSYADAATGVKDGRAVGLTKATGLTSLDAIFIDVSALVPIRLLSLTEEEAKRNQAKLSGSVIFRVPAGTYPQVPDHPDLIGLGGLVNFCALSTVISQDIGYKMVKAWVENWDTLVAAHSGFVPDPVNNTVDYFMAGDKALLPLHACTVQYLKERGIDLPDALIPPEYKK